MDSGRCTGGVELERRIDMPSLIDSYIDVRIYIRYPGSESETIIRRSMKSIPPIDGIILLDEEEFKVVRKPEYNAHEVVPNHQPDVILTVQKL